ncbi:MAG: hypothetical protein PHI40_01835 [Caldisericia bacterium]|nr:hypothetical protein [Caldisericia bacterium]MDD4614134.1 hypothetical protein [Caldisericia bacterium]
MNVKTIVAFILLFSFLCCSPFSWLVSAQPTEAQQPIQTLPEVTLPPPPTLPGTIPQTMEDGSIVFPKDQLHAPLQSDINSLKNEGFTNTGDIDLDKIKPPPVPKELFESEKPPSMQPEIDINEPAQPMELPKANDKPWFLTWWFITLIILFVAGIVIFLFQRTSSDGGKKNVFSSNQQKR